MESERGDITESERQRTVDALYTLLRAYETPAERVWNLVIGGPLLLATIKTCLDLSLFSEWASARDDNAVGSDMTHLQLSELVNADPDLLRRLLRHLAAYGVIREVAPEIYAQSPLSLALCSSGLVAGVWYHCAVFAPLYLQFPRFLQTLGYQAPIDPRDGLFQRHMGSAETVFELHERPAYELEKKNFCAYMAEYKNHRLDWTELYPTKKLLDGFSKGPLLVDVGGGEGNDLQRFCQFHPGYERSVYLEDLPGIIEAATCDVRIQRKSHNFFEEQPVRGSRSYYMHSVLHDWNDDKAIEILSHIRSAMSPGYSKLLVNDIILPPEGVTRLEATVDMQMMVMTSGFERTEGMFRRIFEKAGLRLEKIWRNPVSPTSIAELSVATG